MNERSIELDVSKEGRGTCVRIAQGDVGGTTIRALVYDNGSEVDLSGTKVSLVALLPDGRHYYRGACSIAGGNEVIYVVDEERLCSVAGYTDEAYLEIESDGRKYSTERFSIDIVRSALDGKAPAKDWDNKIEDLIDRMTDADKEFSESEEARRLAENGRKGAEAERVEAESERSSAEASRDEAERGRQDSEQLRSSAEELRAQAEALRSQAEELRSQAEAARAAAEEARAEAEEMRVRAEEMRAESQAKNNADQAANNAAAQGLQVVILSSGQYDPDTGDPTIDGEVGKLYFVPDLVRTVGAHAASVEADDMYVEWMWINDTWERVGMSDATFVPITTDEIDKIADGSGGTGEQVLSLSGLAYLWSKVRGAFAALSHKHDAADIETGVVPVSRGGTGASSASSALTALGAASASDLDSVRDSLSRTSSLVRLTKDKTSLAPGDSTSVDGLSGYPYALVMAYTTTGGLRSSVVLPTSNSIASIPGPNGSNGLRVNGSSISALANNSDALVVYRIFGVTLP